MKVKEKNKNEEINNGNSLIILKDKTNGTLSKNQVMFNNLIKRIADLENNLIETEKLLDGKLKFYGNNLHPLEQKLVNDKISLLKLLEPYLNNNEVLTFKKEREQFKNLMKELLNEISASVSIEEDESLKEIFMKVYRISFEEAAEIEFAEMKEELIEFAESEGLDLDLDEIDLKMSKEELLQKIKEMHEKYQDHILENNKKKSKSKKPTLKEIKEQQMEEVKNKSISSIYKQLAKVLHPDLEQDEDRKLLKEEYMKKLNVAYKNKDMHTLLQLELQWLTKMEDANNSLTEDKLKIYIKVLKEQIGDLKNNMRSLKQHPRFWPIQKYASFFEDSIDVDLEQIKYEIDSEINIVNKQIADLQGVDKLKAIREIIKYTN